MSSQTILLIDDSATIRRLVDTELSAAGFRVLLAPTAEEGLQRADQEQPQLILLDHQLPGTTGYEVCCQLLANSRTARIPVIASSTLRKKAYSEYVDCANVVDMLPKPYTAEVLIATVQNALDTAALVVQSQNQGSSVPEVIETQGEMDLAGTFQCFGLREVIDMLNNGGKAGVLEVLAAKFRLYIYLDKGRIQAITAAGIDPADVARQLPEALSELAPIIKFTVSGRRGSEVDGLCELLDNKVLDPRLLKKLLRLQAAVLLRIGYRSALQSFRFDQGQSAPSLFRKLPLDISQLGLLVEGGLTCPISDLPELLPGNGYARRAIRGQNLDRAGLSSGQMKLLSVLSDPQSLEQLARQLEWSLEETRRVLHGFELAELVEQKPLLATAKVFAVLGSPESQARTAAVLKSRAADLQGKIVRDFLALGLLLRREKPDVLLVELRDEGSLLQLQRLKQDRSGPLHNVRLVAWCATEQGARLAAAYRFDATLAANCSENELGQVLTGQADREESPLGEILSVCG